MDSLSKAFKKRPLKPEQEVVETADELLIDGFAVRFVSKVQTEKIGKDVVKINLEFFAKSYR
ncbi:hypothetical protein [Apilactobacillus kunkeei]|uniref:hypothetical protein n=1 Tax=Apilactobacillus kunkeei TaxID=148814 RepID=UPI001C89D098|nr:hypothetical protein [Apilactobacillus kunkeei]MBX8456274.1 hypothetical protein [Apilactobacillus kunkeei]